MSQEKQIAQQVKDLLTLCLAKAIDQSLCAQLSPNWFYAFLAEDQAQDPKFQIARNGQASIRDLDLQALLKILRYRDRFSNLVFSYYGLSAGSDPFADQTRQRQIRSLLDRLITDFRNSIEAHSRVADIEQEHCGEDNRIYGYREALQDMCKLASLFPGICDSKGKSYYKQIQKLCKPKKHLWWLLSIPAAIAIALVLWLALRPGAEPTEALQAQDIGPTTGNVFYDPGNTGFEPDELTIRPKHVYYEDGKLIAHCYVLNGTQSTLSQIDITYLSIHDSTKQMIAAAQFGVLGDLTLAPGTYGEWTFCFPADTISMKDAQLDSLLLKFSCVFHHSP